MTTETTLTMTVGRDYRMSGRYEYLLARGEEIVARKGFFLSSTQARRAGLKVAAELNS